LRDHSFFRPCYKAHTLPSSKLGDYIGTMHLSVHLSIKFPRRFILDPGTTCLCHLLPGSGLSGHTSSYDEYAYFDPCALFTLLTFLFKNTSGHTSPGRKYFSFSQEHHTFFGQPTSPATTVVGYITS
jgi:hypothetical protein